MKTNLSLLLAVLLPTAASAASLTWTGASTNQPFNQWGDPANWSPKQVPAKGDSATIGVNGAMVCNNASGQVADLTLNPNAQLYLSGSLTVSGTLNIQDATIAGADSGGETLLVTGTNNCTHTSGNLIFYGLVIKNSGLMNLNCTPELNKGTLLDNSGTINVATGVGLNNSDNGDSKIINEAGATFQTSGTTSATEIQVLFDNRGTVIAKSGDLRFEFPVNNTGQFQAQAGAFNHFLAPVTNAANASFTGDGWVIADNPFALQAAVSASNFRLNSPGWLTGPGSLTVSGNFRWNDGTVSASLILLGNSVFSSGALFGGSVLNRGQADWNANDIEGALGGTFINQGTFVQHHDGSFTFDSEVGPPTPQFINQGTFVRTNDAALNLPLGWRGAFTVPFNNTGVVQVDAGQLTLSGGGTNSAQFIVNGTLVLESLNYVCDSNSKITGSGTNQFPGGYSSVSGTYSFDGLTQINGGSVTFSGNNSSSARVALSSGTLSGDWLFTVRSNFDWSGGVISTGRVLVQQQATLNLMFGMHSLGANAVLENEGSGNWSGGDVKIAGDGEFMNGEDGTLVVGPGGIFRLVPGSPAGGEFVNYGTLIQSNSDLYNEYPLRFYNQGVIQLQNSELSLAGGSSSGTFEVSNQSTLDFSSYTNILSGSAAISGEGAVTVHGTLYVTDAPSAQGLSLSGGSLDGSGTLTINNIMAWFSGALNGTGALQISKGATLSLYGADLLGSTDKTFVGRTLTNNGTVLCQGTNRIVLQPGFICNGANASFSIQSQATITSGLTPDQAPTGAFHNNGIFLKTGTGDAVVEYGVLFTNSVGGTIDSEAGLLRLAGGGLNDSGKVVASGSGAIEFGDSGQLTDARFVFNTNSVLSGANYIYFSGYVFLAGTTRAENLTVGTYVSLDGPGDLLVSNRLTWTEGTLMGAGSLQLGSNATFRIISGYTTFAHALQRNVSNYGLAQWQNTGVTVSDGVWFNNYGTFEIWDSTSYSGPASASITNYGVLRKVIDTGTSTIGVAVVNCPSASVQAKSGLLYFKTRLWFMSGSRLSLDGGDVANDSPMVLLGNATMDGSGRVLGIVRMAGKASPGYSPGWISISGDYTQDPSGELDIELAGLVAGTNYDQLAVGGNASLNGVLNVSLLNGYVPNRGDTFQILPYGSRTGDFATYSGLNLPNGLALVPQFDAKGLRLVAGDPWPTLTAQPTSQSAPSGGSVRFCAGASGVPPFTYQWRFNNTDVPGATGACLTLAGLNPNQAGGYQVVVSNASGVVTSSVAVLTVAAAISLPAALDTPTWTWNSGSNNWFGQTNISHDGVSAAASGLIGDSQESWMETTNISGPGTLTYWWKVSSEPNLDYLQFLVDGVVQNKISGEYDWQQTGAYINPGPHVLRWSYVKGGSGSAGHDQGWVDQVVFVAEVPQPPAIMTPPASQTVMAGADVDLWVSSSGTRPISYQWQFYGTNLPGATDADLFLNNIKASQAGLYSVVATNYYGSVTSSIATLTVIQPIGLPQALNTATWSWTTGGDANWFGQPLVTHDGVAAAQSGAISDSQETWLETSSLVGPGTLTFWWKVSCVQDFDFLTFLVDGNLQDLISGKVDWTHFSLHVDAGPHVLHWSYSKFDGNPSAGPDTAWVDQVTFIPDNPGPSHLLRLTLPGVSADGSFTVIAAYDDGTPATADDLARTTIYGSPDPSLPFANWLQMTNPLVLVSGTLQVIGLNTSNAPAQFYRAMQTP